MTHYRRWTCPRCARTLRAVRRHNCPHGIDCANIVESVLTPLGWQNIWTSQLCRHCAPREHAAPAIGTA